MKRIALILALALAASTSVFAQPGPPPGGGPRPGSDPLVTYLNLTEAQKSAWEAARTALEAAVQPLREKERAAHEALGALMEAKSTDACGIGAAMIAIRTVGDQIRALHEADDAKRLAVLTPEQKSKYDAFQAAVQFLRGQEGAGRPAPGR
jgi:Spy/CpxP family protein refolding chaperone